VHVFALKFFEHDMIICGIAWRTSTQTEGKRVSELSFGPSVAHEQDQD
jgi:hypothetical protein